MRGNSWLHHFFKLQIRTDNDVHGIDNKVFHKSTCNVLFWNYVMKYTGEICELSYVNVMFLANKHKMRVQWQVFRLIVIKTFSMSVLKFHNLHSS